MKDRLRVPDIVLVHLNKIMNELDKLTVVSKFMELTSFFVEYNHSLVILITYWLLFIQ